MQTLYPDMESQSSTSPSINERRGRRLAPLQTNFSRPAAHLHAKNAPAPRSRSTDCRNDGDDTAGVPEQAEAVRKQSSKSGLRGLFGRKGNDQAKLSGIEEARGGVADAEDGLGTPLSTSCPTPSTIASAATAVQPPTPDTPKAAIPRSKAKVAKETLHSAETAWKPPPLSLASSHALRRDCLWCPSLDADVILRFRDAESKANAKEGAGDEAPQKKHKKISKGMTNAPGGVPKFAWTQKIYLLTPSAHILQYAGEGKEDRLPEKMMQLGPASVAFASDAVPGKQFVVQISQAQVDEAPSAASESTKPLLSRFGFHRAASSTRAVRNFLLVCSNADKMNSWLTDIRAQIEAQGGKEYIGSRMMHTQLSSDPKSRQPSDVHAHRSSSLFLQPDRPTFRKHGLNQSSQDSTAPSWRSSYYSTDQRSMLSSQPVDIDGSTLSEIAADNSNTPSERSSAAVSGIKHSLSSDQLSPPLAAGGTTTAEPMRTRTTPNVSAPTIPTTEQQAMLPSPPGAGAGMTRLPLRQSIMPDALSGSTSAPAPNFSVPSFSSRSAVKSAQQSDLKASGPQSSTVDVGVPPGRQDAALSPIDTNGADIASSRSPPLSPVRSVTSIGQEVAGDHRLVSTDSLSRPLHISNSEGSLRDALRKADDQTQSSLAQAPRASPSSESIANTISSSPPIQSTKWIGKPLSQGSCTKAQTPNQIPPQRPHDLVPGTSDSPQRIKWTTPAQPDIGRRQCILRRKSLAGLSVGPPSGPPPTCPLPKLPPSVAGKSGLSGEPSTATTARVPVPKSPPLAGVGLPPRRSSLYLRS